MWETWVQSLFWEDPLEKEMATHSSILANKPGRPGVHPRSIWTLTLQRTQGPAHQAEGPQSTVEDRGHCAWGLGRHQ